MKADCKPVKLNFSGWELEEVRETESEVWPSGIICKYVQQASLVYEKPKAFNRHKNSKASNTLKEEGGRERGTPKIGMHWEVGHEKEKDQLVASTVREGSLENDWKTCDAWR